MEGNEQIRKPLNRLTEPQANRMMSTPWDHMKKSPKTSIEMSGEVRGEPQALHSPHPRMIHGGINRPHLYSEFKGSGHRLGFDPDTAGYPQVPDDSKCKIDSTSTVDRDPRYGPRECYVFKPDMPSQTVYQQSSFQHGMQVSMFNSPRAGHVPLTNQVSMQMQSAIGPGEYHRRSSFGSTHLLHQDTSAYTREKMHDNPREFGRRLMGADISFHVAPKTPRKRCFQKYTRDTRSASAGARQGGKPGAAQPTYHPDSDERFQPDRKRLKSTTEHNPRQKGTDVPNQNQSLALPEDEKHLTELHCYVRKHCVYIFSATEDDVRTPRKGRKKALTLGQIGIGCSFCKNSESKLKGSTYFPTSIKGIYNATMIIQQRHFPECQSVPREASREYNSLKGLTARSASTKEYWVSAAKNMGLVDTPKGVFFLPNDQPNVSKRVGISQVPQQEPLPRLVEPSDKMFATEYAYFVMEQMTTCHFTEADRLGKRKNHKLGFPGLACRHCYGGNGSGRFFPLTLKTFSDVSKSIHVLRNHLVKCTKAPDGMAAKVSTLHERHKAEKHFTPFGSQKIFFDNIWKRLHPGGVQPGGAVIAVDVPKKAEETKPLLNQSWSKPHTVLDPAFQTRNPHDTFEPEASTPPPPLPSPPIIHRDKSGSQPNPNKGQCLIPKKRYCLYSRMKFSHRPHLPPLYPRPLDQQGYDEADVSVAMTMIGIGRKTDNEPSAKPQMEEV